MPHRSHSWDPLRRRGRHGCRTHDKCPPGEDEHCDTAKRYSESSPVSELWCPESRSSYAAGRATGQPRLRIQSDPEDPQVSRTGTAPNPSGGACDPREEVDGPSEGAGEARFRTAADAAPGESI